MRVADIAMNGELYYNILYRLYGVSIVRGAITIPGSQRPGTCSFPKILAPSPDNHGETVELHRRRETISITKKIDTHSTGYTHLFIRQKTNSRRISKASYGTSPHQTDPSLHHKDEHNTLHNSILSLNNQSTGDYVLHTPSFLCMHQIAPFFKTCLLNHTALFSQGGPTYRGVNKANMFASLVPLS